MTKHVTTPTPHPKQQKKEMDKEVKVGEVRSGGFNDEFCVHAMCEFLNESWCAYGNAFVEK